MGWYRSPSGVLTHAYGSFVAVCVGRGYAPVPEDEALAEIGGGLSLQTDTTPPPVDLVKVRQALADEAPTPRKRKRATS